MRRFIGLMSGTSVDAVDAVLLEIDERGSTLRTAGLASIAFDDALRDELHALQASVADELERARRAACALADRYADAVDALLHSTGLQADDITAIGAHGQTVRHRPGSGYTIQLLDAARLAERCAIAVVYDLRAADLAAGGQGAPLAAGFHAQVFRSALERRAVVNLGGIANVTLLAAERGCGEPSGEPSDEPVHGFDTGPANTLLDAWCLRHTGRAFDENGNWARSGTADGTLLAHLLEEPYFGTPAPKSTGRDHFHLQWLDAALASLPATAQPMPRSTTHAANVQATLVELTAITVARACTDHGAQAVYACGGGTRNAFLMQRLRARLSPAVLGTTAALGIDPQAVEAAAFAWLAAQRVDAKAGNLPSVTGARGARVLGAIADPVVRTGRST